MCAFREHFRRYAHDIRFVVGLNSTQKVHPIVKCEHYQISSASGVQGGTRTLCHFLLSNSQYSDINSKFKLVKNVLKISKVSSDFVSKNLTMESLSLALPEQKLQHFESLFQSLVFNIRSIFFLVTCFKIVCL